MIKPIYSLSFLLGLSLSQLNLAQAEALKGLSFAHGDWELVCNNTRFCQLVGYSIEGSENAVTVLFSRRAGPNQPIQGKVQLAQWDENSTLKKFPPKFAITLKVNQRNLGKISIDKSNPTSDLSSEQTLAILQALSRKSELVFDYGKFSWLLSDQGAAAVLLKADEFQGRIGTAQAWLKKGSKDEREVLPALAPPLIRKAALPKAQPQDASFAQKNYAELLAALRKTPGNEDCLAIADDAADKPELRSIRLSASQFLISTSCWRAAYNEGEGYWVVNASKPFKPVLVTTDATEYNQGTITSGQKGRGIGDCWSSKQWQWDGKNFVLADSSDTGMCRGIAPGGAWNLNAYETEVR